jgi:hypothetical protein
MTRRPLLPALVAVALAVAGCGGGPEASDAGPATLVPADAALYVEATVKPEGQLREDALAAAGKVLDTSDPATRITELVSRAIGSGEGSNLDYARDIQPWLGDRVALWMSGRDPAAEFKGVAIAAATDGEKARESIRAALRREGRRVSARSHEGVDYEADGEGQGFAIVEEFVVLGTEAELKRTIDAADGESLAENETYRKRLDELPDGRLGHLYADSEVLFRAGAESGEAGAPTPEEYEQIKRIFPVDDFGPYAMALSVTGDRVVVDSVMTAKPSEAFRRVGALSGGVGTELVGELPADAWGAFGIPDLGETARFFYNRVAGALGGAALSQQLRQETGLDLDEDVFSWMGDVAFGQARELSGDEYEPSVFLTVAQVLELVEAAGDAGPEFAEVKAYLDAFTVFTTGGEATDDTVRTRVAAGLR